MAKKMNFCPPGKGEAQESIEEISVSPAYQPIMEWSVSLVNLDGTPSTCAYQTLNSAGIDLVVADKGDVTISPGRRVVIHTGVKLSVTGVPPPMMAMLELRSSMRKNGLSALGVGIIDLDYQDEILLMVQNVDPVRSVKIASGDRVAQLIFLPIIRPNGIEVKQVERKGGVGSTGK